MNQGQYAERIRIKMEGQTVDLATRSGTVLLRKYSRIVVGERGPYIEFEWGDVAPGAELVIPPAQAYRLGSAVAYYVEYRTSDAAAVKIYSQRRTVSYADYRPGMFYVSPFELLVQMDGAWVPVVEARSDRDQLSLFADVSP